MRKVTLRLPTKAAVDLGVVNPRFFRHNESLEVLQAFAAGDAVTQVVRIRRKDRLPPNAEIERRRGELLGRYALRHFEILERDEARNEVTALLTWKIPKALAAIVDEFGADVVPTEPFVFGPDETAVSFYASDDRLPSVYALLDGLHLEYTVSAVHRSRGERGPLAGLSDRQRTLLELAYRLGYFETPAKTSLAHLAALSGVSRAAVSKTLRRAEARVLAATFRRVQAATPRTGG
ncbi:MAG TPA: helix-turn-helix domain-containing protein [Thermoplasmata archaeon]|nr:helix-turn-helix domain-containing protein [Thermoplasmata archaeon]